MDIFYHSSYGFDQIFFGPENKDKLDLARKVHEFENKLTFCYNRESEMKEEKSRETKVQRDERRRGKEGKEKSGKEGGKNQKEERNK